MDFWYFSWSGGGDPCINVFSAERLSHLNVEIEPRIQLCGGGDPCINILMQKGYHT